jgi:hypothetical protein
VTSGSRLPGFLLLAIVIIAAALLLAGLGVAVGTGIIVGLVLGLLAIGAFMAIAQRSGATTGFSMLSSVSTGAEPDHALLERHAREAMRVAQVDDGALRRVVAVGDVAQGGGLRVELIAVELRDEGGLATFAVRARPPVGPAGHIAEVRVSDGVGTVYAAAGQGTSGTASSTRHEVRFAPAPPAAAETLTIVIERFVDPFPAGSMPIEGTWAFDVALGS